MLFFYFEFVLLQIHHLHLQVEVWTKSKSSFISLPTHISLYLPSERSRPLTVLKFLSLNRIFVYLETNKQNCRSFNFILFLFSFKIAFLSLFTVATENIQEEQPHCQFGRYFSHILSRFQLFLTQKFMTECMKIWFRNVDLKTLKPKMGLKCLPSQ